MNSNAQTVAVFRSAAVMRSLMAGTIMKKRIKSPPENILLVF